MIICVCKDNPDGVNLDKAEFIYIDNVLHCGPILSKTQIDNIEHHEATIINAQMVKQLGSIALLKEVKRLTGVECSLIKSEGYYGGYSLHPKKKNKKIGQE